MLYSVSVDVDENEFFRTNIKTDCFEPDDSLEDMNSLFYSLGAEFKGIVSILDRNGNIMMEAGFGSYG